MTWCFRNKLLLGKIKRYKKQRKINIFEEYGFQKTQIWEGKSVFGENNLFLGIFLGKQL